MPSRVLFWTGFGIAVRFWQLGLEMRPFFNRGSLWAWPLFAGTGAAFGHWMGGAEERQLEILEKRKQRLLAKRARRAEREAAEREAEAAEAETASES